MMKNTNSKPVIINGINSRGEGISRLEDGRVIFIPGAIPGEQVFVNICFSKKQYAVGNIEQIVKPHPKRVSPHCQWFGKCGGCQMQHCSYDLQLELKQQIVEDAFSRIGHVMPVDPILKCVPSPKQWGYRNKASFPVRHSEKQIRSGFFRKGSHDLIPIDGCPVLEPELALIYSQITNLLNNLKLPGYNEKNHSGLLRHIILRTGSFSGETFICLVLKRQPDSFQMEQIQKMSKILKSRHKNIKGFIVNINSSRTNTIIGDRSITIHGKGHLCEYLENRQFQYEGTSFFQVNSYQASNIFRYAVNEISNRIHNNVLELYSGVGALTVFLAELAEKITTVEDWKSSIESMRQNLVLNGINNVTIHAAKAEMLLDKLGEETFDTVVMDPPRAGCKKEVIEYICRQNIRSIVYISCNPATLSRDISMFSECGYRFIKARLFDMFPQTSHVETVAILEKL